MESVSEKLERGHSILQSDAKVGAIVDDLRCSVAECITR